MQVTIIRCNTLDVLYCSVVPHECTLGEFLQDIREETKKYVKLHQPVTEIDLFWHLDDYCDKKYGVCHWQLVGTDAILLVSNATPRLFEEKAE